MPTLFSKPISGRCRTRQAVDAETVISWPPGTSGHPIRKRFDALVWKSEGCWLWIGSTDKDGYGRFKVNGSAKRAHRFALAASLGVDVDSLNVVMHTCDNRLCCNPAHLRNATQRENLLDMVAKGRGTLMNGHCIPMPKEMAVARLNQIQQETQAQGDFDPSDYDRHAYCRFCGCEVIVGQRDFGIGLTEYWGARGVHRDMQPCCSRCGEEL